MRQRSVYARLAVFLGFLVCGFWPIGCGSSGPPTGSLSGRVTYNGQPLTTGVITFVNEKTGIGDGCDLDSSGSYRISSIQVGEYRVALQGHPPPPEPPQSLKQGQKSWKLNIPAEYQAPQTSGLTATVKKGKNVVDFAL